MPSVDIASADMQEASECGWVTRSGAVDAKTDRLREMFSRRCAGDLRTGGKQITKGVGYPGGPHQLIV